MTQDEAAQSVRRLKFPPQMESDFQHHYYSRIHTPLRIGVFLMVGAAIALPLAGLFGKALVFGGVILVNLLLLGLLVRRKFVANWQLLVVGTISISTGLVSLVQDYAAGWAALAYVLVLFQMLRLQVRWVLLQMVAVDVVLYSVPQNRTPVSTQIGSDLFLMALPLFLAYRNERGQRSKFAEQLLLTQERQSHQQKLEQTEKMLHVLSQAIGSIAHDLGNPLTVVHGSAETLGSLLKEDALDKETELEFLEMITDGAQMLKYLRLSLMEQTRVLEGKPILVERQDTNVRQIVKAGARYQQPKFLTGREVVLEGEELPLHVDEMRFITLFMNLINNALKYSDGEVKVTWRIDEGRILVAVLDQGKNGRGISQTQAEELFVPFGRLDTHAQVEGTGLGLLSVRKIAEAHEGETYIEGHENGTADAPIFSTAQGRYPPVLLDGFCTAFVTVCPWKLVLPSPQEPE